MEISCWEKSGFLLKHKNVKVEIKAEGSQVEGEGEKVTINGAGEYEIKGVSVVGIKIGKEIVYTFDLDELRVAYLGGLREKLTDSQLDWLDGVDVLLVTGQSEEVVKQVGPSLAVTQELIKGWEGTPRREKKLVVNKLGLPEEMEVILLYA